MNFQHSSLISETKQQQFSTKLTISSCFGLKSSFEDTETYFFKWNSIFPLRRTAKRRLRKSSKLYLVCYFSHRFILERNEFEDVLIIWDKESNGSMYLYLLFESALYLRMTIWEPKSQIQEFVISLLWCLWVGNDSTSFCLMRDNLVYLSEWWWWWCLLTQNSFTTQTRKLCSICKIQTSQKGISTSKSQTMRSK